MIYLFSYEYKCGQCRQQRVGSSAEFLNSAPVEIRLAFPFILSKKLGVTKELGNLLLSLGNSVVGPSAIRRIVMERHSSEFDQRKAIYYW